MSPATLVVLLASLCVVLLAVVIGQHLANLALHRYNAERERYLEEVIAALRALRAINEEERAALNRKKERVS